MRLLNMCAAAGFIAVCTAAGTQRPANMSICDYYTTVLLSNNTDTNQYTLLTLLVNTVVIGNYTKPNVGVMVPGILAPGQYNGAAVNLLPYFNGGLLSSNRGGTTGVAVNFLDGGGAAPLMKNMPANDTASNQYFLLTHLYQFFGSLLGCSQQGLPGFSAYTGHASMYSVHKFMDLDPSELGYFITQVALAAASFGVAQSDITTVGTALNNLFGMRCAPPTVVIPAQGPQLQAICIDSMCPVSPSSTCAAYSAVVTPMTAPTNQTAMPKTTSMNMTTSMPTTTGVPKTIATAGAAAGSVNLVAVGVGLAAFLL